MCSGPCAAGFVGVRLSCRQPGKGDLLDQRTLEHTFAEHRPVAVLHFAACAYVGESFEDRAKFYDNNVIGALHLLDAARSAGNLPIVFSSTCAVYGEPATVPITEDMPLAPVNPYGRTKLPVEYALSDYDAAVAVRPCSIAGADQLGSRRPRASDHAMLAVAPRRFRPSEKFLCRLATHEPLAHLGQSLRVRDAGQHPRQTLRRVRPEP